MADSSWERFAPLTGVVFVVLLVAGVVVINNYDYLPPAGEIESFYEDNSTTVSIGAFLALLSVFFFLWFLGSVRGPPGDVEAQACEPAEGDAVAVLGGNRRLLIFPLDEVPIRSRGRGVILQKYRQGGLADIKTFTLADPRLQGPSRGCFGDQEQGGG